MEYTKDQQEALNKMIAWIKSPSLFYVLDGAAGTGKTTIAKAFIERSKIPFGKIGVTAPTHKAKKVIQKATGFNADTIQSILGLRPNTNLASFSIKRPQFDPIGEETIGRYKILLIDESSMLNKDSFNLICKRATDKNVKVLFMGDAYQLPPVNEKISKVFTDITDISTLNTVVRQKDINPISNILIRLREDIKNNESNIIRELSKITDNTVQDKGYQCLSPNIFGTKTLEFYFSTEYAHNIDHMKFLTYTNNNLELWGESFREKILKEKANDFLIKDEYLIGYETVRNGKYQVLIENSETYKVISVRSFIKEGVKGKITTLESEEGGEKTMFIVDPKSYDDLKVILYPKLKEAQLKRGRFWAKYYAAKREFIVLHPLSHMGEPICKRDLYYSYSCSVHKSQGSTYDNVAINLNNILLINSFKKLTVEEKIYQINRLLYVALSRAKNMNLIMIK